MTTNAIENDSAPETLADDLAAAWEEQEAASGDAQDASEAVIEDETTDDTIEDVEASDEASDEDTGDEIEEADEDVEGLVAPEHWSKADREMFDSLDDAAKEFVNRRYSSMEKDYHSKTQKAASSIRYSDQIKDLLNPFREQMQLAGIDDVTAISKLVAAQALLERSPKEGIKHLAKSYGVDLDAIEYDDTDYDEVDPKIAALEAKIAQMEKGMTENSLSAHTAKIEEFASAVDDSGKLLHPHFEEVYDDMVTLVKSRVATDIDSAYQKAIWANDSVRAKMLAAVDSGKEQARKAALAKKTAAAKRIAKANISGTGDASEDTGKDLGLRESLSRNYDQLVS